VCEIIIIFLFSLLHHRCHIFLRELWQVDLCFHSLCWLCGFCLGATLLPVCWWLLCTSLQNFSPRRRRNKWENMLLICSSWEMQRQVIV